MSNKGVNPIISGLASLARSVCNPVGKVIGSALAGTSGSQGDSGLDCDFVPETKNMVARLIELGEVKISHDDKGKILVRFKNPRLEYIITGKRKTSTKKKKKEEKKEEIEETSSTEE
jgi:hypothetical protein